MSSKIGDYIHFYADNYLNYGLNYARYGEDKKTILNKPNPQQEMNKQITLMQNALDQHKLNAIDIKMLEDQYNQFFSDVYNKEPNKDQAIIMKAVLDEMERLYPRYGGRIDSTMNPNNLSKKKSLEKLSLRIVKAESTGTRMSTISSRLTAIGNALKNLENQTNIGAKESISLDLLRTTFNNLNTQFKALEDEVKQFHKNTKYLPLIKAGGMIGSIKREKFIEELNDLISLLSSPNQEMVGTYAELSVLAMNAYAAGKATEVVDILRDQKNRFLGKSVSSKGLDGFNFSPSFVDMGQVARKSQEIIKNKANIGDSVWTVNETQDKVDITIEYGGTLVPASIKNYRMNINNSAPNIHFLSGKSVIGLVQEYGNFVNHYLNIAAPHEGQRDYSSSVQTLKNLADEAQEAMKLTILRKAIEGGVVVQNKVTNGSAKSLAAELLIINDHSGSKGKVRIYSIGEIVARAAKNLNLLKTGAFDNMVLDNSFVGSEQNGGYSKDSAKQRITRMIAQLNNASLQVSLNKEVWSSDFGYVKV